MWLRDRTLSEGFIIKKVSLHSPKYLLSVDPFYPKTVLGVWVNVWNPNGLREKVCRRSGETRHFWQVINSQLVWISAIANPISIRTHVRVYRWFGLAELKHFLAYLPHLPDKRLMTFRIGIERKDISIQMWERERNDQWAWRRSTVVDNSFLGM